MIPCHWSFVHQAIGFIASWAMMSCCASGWAAFPSEEPNAKELKGQSQSTEWDPFGNGGTDQSYSSKQDQPAAPKAESSVSDKSQLEQENSEGTKIVTEDDSTEAAESKPCNEGRTERATSQEFSNFSFWRQPVEEIIDE